MPTSEIVDPTGSTEPSSTKTHHHSKTGRCRHNPKPTSTEDALPASETIIFTTIPVNSIIIPPGVKPRSPWFFEPAVRNGRMIVTRVNDTARDPSFDIQCQGNWSTVVEQVNHIYIHATCNGKDNSTAVLSGSLEDCAGIQDGQLQPSDGHGQLSTRCKPELCSRPTHPGESSPADEVFCWCRDDDQVLKYMHINPSKFWHVVQI